ncbi:hypothetical protein B0H14DRAFT_2701852, partial [Mycena olivaceomarginata]
MPVPPTSPLHPRDRSVDAARLFPGLPIDANHANPFQPRHARTQRPHSLAADSSERASGRRPSYRFYLRLPALAHPRPVSLRVSGAATVPLRRAVRRPAHIYPLPQDLPRPPPSTPSMYTSANARFDPFHVPLKTILSESIHTLPVPRYLFRPDPFPISHNLYSS